MKHLSARAVCVVVLALLDSRAEAARPPDLRGAVFEEGVTSVLLLEVWINGRDTAIVLPVTLRGRDQLLRRADIGRIGLDASVVRDAGDAAVALQSLQGVSSTIDAEGQRLLVRVPVAMLAAQAFDLRPAIDDIARSGSATGAALSYDLSVTADDAAHAGSTTSGGAQLALNLFSGNLLFQATGFGVLANGGNRGARLETALTFDDDVSLTRYLIGDAITGGLDWTRSVRFAGLQIRRDFSLRPDLVTLPLPSFFGRTDVPAAVEVFSGAARVFEQDIEAGPFALSNLPIVTGGGEATVLVRDALGRQTSQTFSLFVTDRLLATGLWDFDASLGVLRRKYGLASFAYGEPIASGTVRFGLSDAVTIESHAEASPRLALGGAGATIELGSFGVVSLDAAYSASDQGAGALASISLQGRAGPISLFARWSGYDGRYRDLASLGNAPQPRLQADAGLIFDLKRFGSLNMSWIEQRFDHQPADSFLTASYALSLGNGVFFGVTGLRDFAARNWAGQAYLSISFGHDVFASAGVSSNANGIATQAALTRPVSPDGGLGLRLMEQSDVTDLVRADATWIDSRGQFSGAIAYDDGKIGVQAGASGGIVVLDGGLFASRKPDGGVALVKTGRAGARVLRENREVAVADGDGDALLTGLVPYTANRIAIDPRDYPLDTTVERTDAVVAPPRQGGVIVDLAPAIGHGAVAVVLLPSGAFPPVGAKVRFDAPSSAVVVGHRGRIYVADASKALQARIETGGGECVVHIAAVTPARGAIPQIGPLTCEIEAR